MSRVYGFIKIKKKQTNRGLVAAGIGIVTLACLVFMVVIAFFKGGTLPAAAGLLGYLTFAAALVGLKISADLRLDNEAYGKMVHTSLYFCLASVAAHIIIFMIGCLSLLT